MTDSERILEIIRVKGLSNVQFCSLSGVSPATLSHITSGRSNPTLPILRNIIKGFPDLNPIWVYSGEGEMFREFDTQEENQADSSEAIPAHINNEEGEQMDRSGAADGALATHSMRGNRSSATRQTPDLFGNFDNPMSGNSAAASRLAANATLADVVRETITQVQPQPRRLRQITEIRIFFDDGTYESFGGPK